MLFSAVKGIVFDSNAIGLVSSQSANLHPLFVLHIGDERGAIVAPDQPISDQRDVRNARIILGILDPPKWSLVIANGGLDFRREFAGIARTNEIVVDAGCSQGGIMWKAILVGGYGMKSQTFLGEIGWGTRLK